MDRETSESFCHLQREATDSKCISPVELGAIFTQTCPILDQYSTIYHIKESANRLTMFVLKTKSKLIHNRGGNQGLRLFGRFRFDFQVLYEMGSPI